MENGDFYGSVKIMLWITIKIWLVLWVFLYFLMDLSVVLDFGPCLVQRYRFWLPVSISLVDLLHRVLSLLLLSALLCSVHSRCFLPMSAKVPRYDFLHFSILSSLVAAPLMCFAWKSCWRKCWFFFSHPPSCRGWNLGPAEIVLLACIKASFFPSTSQRRWVSWSVWAAHFPAREMILLLRPLLLLHRCFNPSSRLGQVQVSLAGLLTLHLFGRCWSLLCSCVWIYFAGCLIWVCGLHVNCCRVKLVLFLSYRIKILSFLGPNRSHTVVSRIHS
jgi:hypothetical protein